HGLGCEKLEFHLQAKPAAILACSAGIRNQAVTSDLNRHLSLVDLDRRVLEEGHVGAAPFRAVRAGTATGPTANRSDRSHDGTSVARRGLDVHDTQTAAG